MTGRDHADDAEPTEVVADSARAGDGDQAGPSGDQPAPGEPPAGAAAGDEQTARMEPAEQRPAVGPSGTSVMPSVPDEAESAPPPPRWAARAQVPPPRVEEYGEDWVMEPPRSVFLPVLITVSVMVLFGVLGVGVWLLVSNRPGPAPTTPPPTSAPATTTTTTTTPPPTTTTSASPTGIVVPGLAGEEYDDAAEELTELGLEPQREDVFSSTVPEGRVIGTDPTEGSTVAKGDTITVFVSRGPAPTASPTPTETTTTTPTETSTTRDRAQSQR